MTSTVPYKDKENSLTLIGIVEDLPALTTWSTRLKDSVRSTTHLNSLAILLSHNSSLKHHRACLGLGRRAAYGALGNTVPTNVPLSGPPFLLSGSLS